MYLEIKEARYVPRYKVELRFSDGARQVVDFGPFLRRATNPMFTKYRRLKEFRSFQVRDGDVIWGDFEMVFPIADLHKGRIGVT
jgi:hypothetical protein